MHAVFYGVSCIKNKLTVDNTVNNLACPLRDNLFFSVIFSLTVYFRDKSSIYYSRNSPANQTLPIEVYLTAKSFHRIHGLNMKQIWTFYCWRSL